jgi:hypothetical protein
MYQENWDIHSVFHKTVEENISRFWVTAQETRAL